MIKSRKILASIVSVLITVSCIQVAALAGATTVKAPAVKTVATVKELSFVNFTTNIMVGAKPQYISVTGKMSDGSKKVIKSGVLYSSSNPSIVEVGKLNGKVLAKGTGKVTIKATMPYVKGKPSVSIDVQSFQLESTGNAKGTAQFKGDQITVMADGGNSWGDIDEGTVFLYQKVKTPADKKVVVSFKVNSCTGGTKDGGVGVSFRASNNLDASSALIRICADTKEGKSQGQRTSFRNKWSFENADKSWGSKTALVMFWDNPGIPIELKLEKVGDVVKAYYRKDDGDWVQAKGDNANGMGVDVIGDEMMVGIASFSCKKGELTKSVISDYSVYTEDIDVGIKGIKFGNLDNIKNKDVTKGNANLTEASIKVGSPKPYKPYILAVLNDGSIDALENYPDVQVEYSIDDTTIATCDADGNIKAIAEGKTKYNVKVKFSGKELAKGSLNISAFVPQKVFAKKEFYQAENQDDTWITGDYQLEGDDTRVGAIGEVGDAVEYHVVVDKDGEYAAVLQYASDASDNVYSLYINGVFVNNLTFARSGGWGTYIPYDTKLNLKAGNNDVKFLRDEDAKGCKGAINMDFLQIVGNK